MVDGIAENPWQRLLLVALLSALGAVVGGLVAATAATATEGEPTLVEFAGKVVGAFMGWLLAARLSRLRGDERTTSDTAQQAAVSPVTGRLVLVALLSAVLAAIGGFLGAWWTAPKYGAVVVLDTHFKELFGIDFWEERGTPDTQWGQANLVAVVGGLATGALLGWCLGILGSKPRIRDGCGILVVLLILSVAGFILSCYVAIRLGVDNSLPAAVCAAIVASLPFAWFLVHRWRRSREPVMPDDTTPPP